MMAQEPDLHALLRAKTSVPVPAVVAYDTTHDLLDHDYILMERLPGQPLSHSPSVDTDRVLFDVGQCLAQVHALTAEAYGYLGAHHPMPPQSSWPAAFFVMWEKLLCDIVQVGLYTAGERQMLLHLLDRHMSCFEHPVPAALLHMDVWGQNILVDADGRLTGLLDWDRALWGDPEIEFAVLDYCGISVPAFWEGYGRVRPQTQEAQIRRMFYLLYELQKYMVICEGRGHDTAGARGYKRQSLQLIEQLK
jgi:fructosamine-3-kinase